MKIRTGFVSNSSSSSFVIMKRDLSPDQIELIKMHGQVSEKLMIQGTHLDLTYYHQPWDITDTELTLEGNTWMDNFDMSLYLEKVVGLDMTVVDWN